MNAIIEHQDDYKIGKVFEFQRLLETAPAELKRVLDVFHHFSHGLYCRELRIPAGTTLVGELHKYPQLNILIQGSMTLVDGSNPTLVQAPYITCSPAGVKRAAYAHEDCIWLTIHGTHETDLDKIEEQFIAKTQAEYIEHCRQLQLPGI